MQKERRKIFFIKKHKGQLFDLSSEFVLNLMMH